MSEIDLSRVEHQGSAAEAGPSRDPAKTRKTTVPMTVHPLVWAIQLWVVASVVSLVLSAGLSRALRGAYVGAETWIRHIDHSAALTSQVAAICTTLLLVYVGMLSARVSTSRIVGLGAAALGVAPTLLVFYAHRFAMPLFYTWVSTLCGGLVLLSTTQQCRAFPILRGVVAMGGLSLLAAALHRGGVSDSPELSEVGAALESLFAWGALVLAALFHLWIERRKPLRAALLFGGTLLLASTTSASAQETIPRWVLLTGRSLSELSSSGVTTSGGSLGFSLAILLMVSTLLSRPGSLAQLVSSILALCCFAPTSPLVIAWMTLCGYIAAVTCWTPEPR